MHLCIQANFDTRYINAILKKERKSPKELTVMDAALLQDQEVKSFLQKYDGNSKVRTAVS